MAVSVTESNSYAYGGHANRTEITREVTITGAAAGDFDAGDTITAASLGFASVTHKATVINATGQALDLVPSFNRTSFIIFPKGTYTLTDLVFKGVVTGR